MIYNDDPLFLVSPKRILGIQWDLAMLKIIWLKIKILASRVLLSH